MDADATLSALSGLDGLAPEAIEALARSGWSYVGSVPASYWPDYGYDAPTYGDSTTAGGILWTYYMVVAQTDDRWTFWESPPFPGYSVDNLAPGGVCYYLVAAEDVHGNEGPPSNEASSETWTGVDDLADGLQSPGRKLVAWDGTDDAGGTVASGVYFFRMETESFEAQRKLILLR